MPKVKTKTDAINLKVMALADLKPHPKNPRVADESELDALRVSIETFGLYQAPVWNKRNGFLVTGHQRVTVLQRMERETAQVNVVDLDEQTHVAMMVADNNSLLTGHFTDTLPQLMVDFAVDDEFPGLRFDALAKLDLVDGIDLSVLEKHVDEQETRDPTTALEVRVVIVCTTDTHGDLVKAIKELIPEKLYDRVESR